MCSGHQDLSHQGLPMVHDHCLPLWLSHQQRFPGRFQEGMHQRLPYPPIKTAAIVGIQIGSGVLADGKTQEEVSTVL